MHTQYQNTHIILNDDHTGGGIALTGKKLEQFLCVLRKLEETTVKEQEENATTTTAKVCVIDVLSVWHHLVDGGGIAAHFAGVQL